MIPTHVTKFVLEYRQHMSLIVFAIGNENFVILPRARDQIDR